MGLKEIKLYARNMLAILSSIVNINGGGGGIPYDHLMSTRIFTLKMKKVFM